MAQTWTRDVGIGSFGSLIRTRVTLLSQDRAANSSRVQVEVSIYNGGRSRSWDVSVGMSLSGTVSYSGTHGIDVPGYSWQLIMNQVHTIAHNADGSKAFTISGTLGQTGTETFGSGGTATVSGTLPRLMLAPAAPTGLSAVRVSDAAQQLSWSNRAAARAPYERLQVQRMAESTRSWGWVTTGLSGSAAAYRDSGTVANDRFFYRVRAVNAAGTSEWARVTDTSDVSTTPAPPTGVSARKSGANIIVSWTDQARTVVLPRTFVVEDSPDGGAWVQVGTVGASATSWTHASPSASQTHRYRVRARITEKGNTLTSAPSGMSDTVQLQAPPKAPTLLDPRDGAVVPLVGGTGMYTWRHNPVDTTEQTGAILQWRQDGGALQTITVTGPAEQAPAPQASDPTGVGRAVIEWQVRTKGADPAYGLWSPLATVIVAARPSVAVQAPADGSTVQESRLTVTWAYSPSGTHPQLAQHGWRVTLSDAEGEVLEVAAGDGAAAEVQLETRLRNQVGYGLLVEVRNGDGLWSVADDGRVSFRTDFPLPALIESFPTWDHDTASVNLAFGDMGEARATYEWAGTPHASESVMSVNGVEVARNLVRNPLGPTASTITGWTVTAGDLLTLDDEDGRPAAFLAQGEGTTDSLYMDPVERPAPPVGTRMIFSADIRVTTPVQRMRVTVSGYSGATATVTGSTYQPQSPEDGWVRYSVEAVVTAMPTGGYFRTLIWPANGEFPAGEGFYVRDVLLTTTEGVAFFDGDTPSVTDAAVIDVERNDGDGWVLIASGITVPTMITDRTPRIGTVRYRAVGRTTLPTERVGPEAVAEWPFAIAGAWVSGGGGFERVCTAMGASAEDDPEIEQAAKQFAGIARPVAFFGTARTHRVGFSGTIPLAPNATTVSTREEWEALLHEYGIVCYRDPVGRKRFGLLTVSFSQDGPLEALSLSVEETHYVEGVPRVSDAQLIQQIGGGA